MGRSDGTNVPVWVRHLLLGPQWAPKPRSENADGRIIARLAGTVAAGIAVLFAVVAALPASSDDRSIVLISTILPFGAAVVYFRVGERFPFWAHDVGGLGAATTLALLVVHGGPLVPTLPAIYLLLGTSEMAMRVPTAAAAHVAALAASYGIGLWLTDSSQPLVRWVCLVAAMLSCGTFVRLLTSTVLTLTYTEKRARAEAEEAAIDLAAASDEKSKFLSRMSHELRTPLNAIIGFADVLRGGLGGELGPGQVEYVEDIAVAGHQLLELVDEVLDLSQVESGAFDLQRISVDLDELVTRSLSTVQVVADQAGVELRGEVRSSCRVVVDDRRVGQVLLNLLSNAIRFAGSGGRVTLVATVENDRAFIRVEDTGPGIPLPDQAQVFEAYHQADGVLDGTGLGLPLARQLVEAHGGRLDLDATYTEGAAFVCDIPIHSSGVALAPDDPIAVESNPYEAFTHPGSQPNRELVARAGVWFATCMAIFAGLLAIIVDAAWTPRMGFAALAVVATASAFILWRVAARLTTLHIEVLVLFGAIVFTTACYFATDFRDVAILPFAWLTFTGWSLRNHSSMVVKALVFTAAYGLVLVAGPSDPLAAVRLATAIFLVALSAVVARVLVSELSTALVIEREARADADALRRQVGAAARHKSEFMAGMSHELRTPLNAILGFADVLLQGYAGPLDDRQQGYIRDIRHSGAHLLQLINDILELARMEAHGRPRGLEPVALSPLVDDTVARLRPTASARGVCIHIEETSDSTVLGDPRSLSLAVDNLVANAVKFSPDTKSVGIRLWTQDATVTLEVRDHGIGIRPEQIPHIFEPFQQGSEPVPAHARGGTGLGLALAHGVAELHGGSLEVESSVQEGSAFTLRLPIVLSWIPEVAEAELSR